jgi:membrane associated rhomboid family serine protease
LIHADIGHLAFNMISLYLFGDFVEEAFGVVFGNKGKILYLIMYVLALFFCLLPTFAKHKNDYYYRSLGASGAVSAVIFVGILLQPQAKIGLFFIPPIIPGYVFGPIYLIASSFLERRSRDNVNHSAHFWGAIFGIIFVVALAYILKTDYQPLQEFASKVRADLGM